MTAVLDRLERWADNLPVRPPSVPEVIPISESEVQELVDAVEWNPSRRRMVTAAIRGGRFEYRGHRVEVLR